MTARKRTAEENAIDYLDRLQRDDAESYNRLIKRTCTSCGAKSDERCRTKSGKVAHWHVARLQEEVDNER